MRAYLKFERFVHPLRFLNLLPLSHVFGQFLGMFLPPLLGATALTLGRSVTGDGALPASIIVLLGRRSKRADHEE